MYWNDVDMTCLIEMDWTLDSQGLRKRRHRMERENGKGEKLKISREILFTKKNMNAARLSILGSDKRMRKWEEIIGCHSTWRKAMHYGK